MPSLTCVVLASQHSPNPALCFSQEFGPDQTLFNRTTPERIEALKKQHIAQLNSLLAQPDIVLSNPLRQTRARKLIQEQIDLAETKALGYLAAGGFGQGEYFNQHLYQLEEDLICYKEKAISQRANLKNAYELWRQQELAREVANMRQHFSDDTLIRVANQGLESGKLDFDRLEELVRLPKATWNFIL